MPRWVEPDPPDDGGGDTGGAGETPAESTDRGDLSQKPVLEWTNDDWARWVDSPGLALPHDDEPEEQGEGRDEPVPATAPPAEAAYEPAPGAPPEPPGPEWVRLLEEVAPAGAADVVEPAPVEPGRDGAPGDEGDGAEVDEELAPTGEWFLALDEGDDEPGGGPAIVTGTFPVARPPAAGETEPAAPWTDEEWAEVEEHPWWQSAPEPDPATARMVAVEIPLEPEPAVEARVEPVLAPLPAAPSAPEPLVPPFPLSPPKEPAPPAPPTRITRPAPARPAGGTTRPGPAVYIDETSHRVRAAFSLLGVAVLVGTVMAGLITIIVFAISLALRQAVG